MSKLTYLVLVIVVAAALLLRNGPSTAAVSVLLAFAALAAIPLYFATRDRSRPASGGERVAATAWVWVRRILGVGMGLFMLTGAVFMAIADTGPPGLPNRWVGVFLLAFLGAFLVYFGFVGQGAHRYQWRDDVELHGQNKRRYRWWF